MAEGFVIDSTVLVDQWRGRAEALAFVRPLAARHRAWIHPVGAAELLVGAADRKEQALVDQFLSRFRVLSSRASDWTAALELVRSLRLVYGIGWPDCLIAASCIRMGLTLATANDKHFRPIQGLRVVRPY